MGVKLLTVSCNHCGAPLQVPLNTHYVTCAHCRSQLLVERSGSAYFTTVREQIQRIVQNIDAAAEDLSTIKLQNELERLDREWNMTREKYLIRDKDGNVSEPDTNLAGGMAAVIGLICVGILLTVAALIGSMGNIDIPFAFAGLGVLTVCMAIYLLITHRREVSKYREIKTEYQYQRQRLVNDLQRRSR